MRMRTVSSRPMWSAAERTASPVPLGSSWVATSTPSGSWSASRRCGPSTTTTRPAPASCAARIGQPIIGRPQIGCRTLGVSDFMRVPSPAARISTVGAGTRASEYRHAGGAFGGSSNGKTPVFGAGYGGSIPPPPASRSVRRMWEHTFVSRRLPFTELQLRVAVEASRCCSDVLRHLGLRTAGGNPRTIQKYVALWDIPVDHFDPDAVRATTIRRQPIPLAQLLIEHSTYDRGHLKDRLYATGLKARSCELSQGEIWRGAQMSLILDHINGVATDNRLENLRIVCPNCNATLATHCGRANRRPPRTAHRAPPSVPI